MFPAKSTSGFVFSLFLLSLLMLDLEMLSAQNTDHRINDDSGTAVQTLPALAMNPYGQAVAVWQDNRDGKPAVYAQMITHRGFANKKNFKVNGDDHEAICPDVAINDIGHYVVVWESRSDSLRIHAQTFANNGTRIGQTLRVDTRARALGTNSSRPEVGIDHNGGFAVCWTDLTMTNGDVLIQRFARDGSRRGGNQIVNTTTSGVQKESSMAMNASGELVIAWSDDRLASSGSSTLEIFAQLFTAWGERRGGNFQVSRSPAGINAYASACAMQPNGEFMICWNYLQNYQRIYVASFEAGGRALSKPVAVSDTVHSAINTYPDICPVQETSYAIAWKSMPTDEIVLRLADRLGALGPGPNAISDVPGTENNVSLSYGDVGFIALFDDDVNGHRDIYGTRIGPDVPLNVYAGSNFQRMVPVTWDANYGRSDIRRYRIQRREGSAPYADVATIDLASRGPGGANMRDWIDTTVTAGHTYSYIVYAQVGDTPYPSVPVAATPASARPRINARFAYDTPVIDGVLAPGEWADAEKVTLGNPYAPQPLNLFVKFRMEGGAGMLYVAVDDPNDETLDPANSMGVLFDLNRDGKWDASAPSKEGMITITSSGATFTGYWGHYPNALGADATVKATGIDSKISQASGHVQYEAAFNLDSSPLRILDGSVRAAFWVSDPGNFYPTHYGNAGEWPLGALWECAATLGDLVFAMSAVPIAAFNWPMARKTREQSAWAFAEHNLKPPFQYQFDYGQELGVFREMAVYQSTLVATAKDVWTVNHAWKLHAFDIPSGTRVWSYSLPNSWTWAATHPAVNDSLVLVGDGGSNTLYALGRRTGHLRWQKRLPQLGKQDPILDGTRVYIVSDSLYCLDVYSGRTVWHAPAGSNVAGILAMDATNIYYADGAKLGSWEKPTGSRTWLRDNTGQPSVVVDELKLYTFHNQSFLFRLKAEGGMWWGTNATDSPYPEESNVLAASDSFTLVRDPGYSNRMRIMAVNKSNSHIVWGRSFDSTFISPPTIANNLVYLRTWNTRKDVSREAQSSLTALNLWTGETVATIYDSAFISDPIVAQGKLFVATNHSVRAYSNDRITAVQAGPARVKNDYTLLQNYPNPFNPATTIRYRLEKPDRVTLRIYNAAGQVVRTLMQDAVVAPGSHEVRWDGRSEAGQTTASGVYIARLQTGAWFTSIKLLLMK